MDKQKIIQTEELIGIIQGAVGGCATYWASLIAEEVLKYYQPKIPKGGVVLTEEKDEIINFLVKRKVQGFAERVKMAFYYEFDELIPSIMADKIDKICKEIVEGKV
jgi:hypothetical protein